MNERSMDSVESSNNYREKSSSRLKPILEQQDLIVGDHGLSAIQSNESFETESKDTHAQLMKNYLHSMREHVPLPQTSSSTKELNSSRSKKQIISVTVTPALKHP